MLKTAQKGKIHSRLLLGGSMVAWALECILFSPLFAVNQPLIRGLRDPKTQ